MRQASDSMHRVASMKKGLGDDGGAMVLVAGCGAAEVRGLGNDGRRW